MRDGHLLFHEQRNSLAGSVMGTKRRGRLTIEQKQERARILPQMASESAAHGIELSEHEWALLHKRVASLVCSWRWEQDLVALVSDGTVPVCVRRHDQLRAFFKMGYYPPGGAESAMVRCTCCQTPMPPVVIGSTGLCFECYQLNLDDGASAMQPSAARFVWMVRDKEAIALLAEGYRLCHVPPAQQNPFPPPRPRPWTKTPPLPKSPPAPPWGSFRIAPTLDSRSFDRVTQTVEQPPTPGMVSAVLRVAPARILAGRSPPTETPYSRHMSITSVITTSYLKKCKKVAI
jgi:hypothetical protein